uniref:hypothetical protein n=1 Tax=uncultured Bacteroides sp. TaxID=162156 RepID=UPI0025D69F2A|nr:hypothetical protein [uncultured Bacteroides sp.]
MKALINKMSYAIAVLAYLIGMLNLNIKDSIFSTIYFLILPLYGVVILLFHLILDVDNTKLKEGDLFVFFYFMISMLYTLPTLIHSGFGISPTFLFVSGVFALLASKTDKYWAKKKE